jgi:hypothetical protein
MSTTTKSGGIFTFDHGQKKLHNAIGVTEEYLDDLSTKSTKIVVSLVFTEDKQMNEDYSPSQLVEACLSEFSYSQLVILASMHLQERVSEAVTKMAKMIAKKAMNIKTVGIDSDDIPPHIKEILDGLTGGESRSSAIDGDSLPQELKDFLQKLIEERDNDDDDDDDDDVEDLRDPNGNS